MDIFTYQWNTYNNNSNYKEQSAGKMRNNDNNNDGYSFKMNFEGRKGSFIFGHKIWVIYGCVSIQCMQNYSQKVC